MSNLQSTDTNLTTARVGRPGCEHPASDHAADAAGNPAAGRRLGIGAVEHAAAVFPEVAAVVSATTASTVTRPGPIRERAVTQLGNYPHVDGHELLSSTQITSLIQQASAAYQAPATTLQSQEQPIQTQDLGAGQGPERAVEPAIGAGRFRRRAEPRAEFGDGFTERHGQATVTNDAPPGTYSSDRTFSLRRRRG